LDILFADEKLKKLLNTERVLKREYGIANAKVFARRMSDLRAAPCLKVMASLLGRCEELKFDRKGQLSLRLHGGYRLVFEPAHDPVPRRPDGGLDWSAVTGIRILEIVDYHD
jgi:plasmid maintenance system killer protein